MERDYGKMTKRKALILITKLMAWQRRGANWISFGKSFFNYYNVILIGGMVKLLFPAVPYSVLITILIVLGFLMEFVKTLIGYLDFKKGIWEIQAEWASKNQVTAPYNREMMATLREICKKLNIKSKFTEVEEDKKDGKGLQMGKKV